MKYRKLRIAWSVVCGVACLLLIALCVRSYQKSDFLFKIHGAYPLARIMSNHGVLNFLYRPQTAPPTVPTNDGWHYVNYPAWDNQFERRWTFERDEIDFPHWFPVVLATAATVAPWLPRRFSLRTLLIGMTVAAIGLGWLVYALRN